MSELDLLPQRLSDQSISEREIVLPIAATLEAIDLLESNGRHIIDWEGWVKDTHGRVGHGTAPQGTTSLQDLSVQEAAQICRSTIPPAAAQWAEDNPGTTDSLHFCITVQR